MTYLPIILFAIAAVGGLTLVIINSNGKKIPMILAMGHGGLAAAGLIALIVNVIENTANTLMNVSLGLFVIVAMGGFALFSFHLRNKSLPNALIAVHGLGAVITFIILLMAVL